MYVDQFASVCVFFLYLGGQTLFFKGSFWAVCVSSECRLSTFEAKAFGARCCFILLSGAFQPRMDPSTSVPSSLAVLGLSF
jgi:hypothetical protein